MYTRYPNYRFQGKVRLPENYSGSAFSGVELEGADTPESEPSNAQHISENHTEIPDSRVRDEDAVKTSVLEASAKRTCLPPFGFDALRLFTRGFGFEELLLVSLILLISQGEGDDELVLLLILLLFVR